VKVGAADPEEKATVELFDGALPDAAAPVNEKVGMELDEPAASVLATDGGTTAAAPPEVPVPAPNEKAALPVPEPNANAPVLPELESPLVTDPKENAGVAFAERTSLLAEKEGAASTLPPDAADGAPNIGLGSCAIVDGVELPDPKENDTELADPELVVPTNEKVGAEVPKEKPELDDDGTALEPAKLNTALGGSTALDERVVDSVLTPEPAPATASSSSISLLPDDSRPTSCFFSGH
jgi:hypothetical protein